MCRGDDCTGRCSTGFKAFLLAGAVASSSATPRINFPVRGASGGIGQGQAPERSASEVHAEEHRRLQNGNTPFDTSCDAGADCKTMAACDVAGGYPMTEDLGIFNSICLNNVYYAERAFTGLYDHGGYLDGSTTGYYKCSCCGLPLYSSDHAYDAHSGWPAYFDTIDGRAVSDDSNAVLHNAANGELVCKQCGMHLGHRFSDGPRPTGLRDCIDSACLSFVAGSSQPPPAALAAPAPAPAAGGAGGGQTSVYFGAGCYWHTQYDMYMAESGPAFRRAGATITAHVGYAGGYATGTNGLVCYHSNMPGTLYSDMGHGEATEVLLDGGRETAQFDALLEAYFEEFVADRTGKYSRLDPQDWGLAYRCMVGIPGGLTGVLGQQLAAYNTAHLNMELVPGRGRADTLDEYKIYVYDTATFPFYRGEQYHQFHANSVLGRAVPTAYTNTLKHTQAMAGLIGSTGCPDNLIHGTPAAGAATRAPPPPPPAPRPPPPPADGSWGIAGTFAGQIGVGLIGGTQDVTVSLPAGCTGTTGPCDGTISYVHPALGRMPAITCEGTLTFLRAAEITPGQTIYTFSEAITTGGCPAHLTVDLAAASGGLGYRNTEGVSALLAVTGPPLAVGDDLMVSADACESSLAVFAARISTECCTGVGASCVGGVPRTCNPACANMWLPFSTRCGDYVNNVRPELRAFTAACSIIGGGGH